MEMTREMFFLGKDLRKEEVVQAILNNPNYWVEILEFIGDEMRKDSEYEYEKKWLKMKYHHDLKELKEKYGMPLDDNEE